MGHYVAVSPSMLAKWSSSTGDCGMYVGAVKPFPFLVSNHDEIRSGNPDKELFRKLEDLFGYHWSLSSLRLSLPELCGFSQVSWSTKYDPYSNVELGGCTAMPRPMSNIFERTKKAKRTMIRLFKVKEKQKELAQNANGGPPMKKQSAGELRLHKDISELNLSKSCIMSFPNGKDDLMNFEVSIKPDDGYYLGGTFLFTFQVSPIYPHEAPKVKCKTKVYHPNIDLEGNVCLNILREDWKPVLNINTEPNHEDPLNHDAAAVLRDNPKMFESNVRRAMAGGFLSLSYDDLYGAVCMITLSILSWFKLE
ncbi:hypothetical protein ACFE04_022438 [Oxalis oulophora]